MMAAFAAYIKTITALTFLAALTGILLPEGKYRRYADLILGALRLTAVLSPLLRLFGAADEIELPRLGLEEYYAEYERQEREWLRGTYQTELGE